MNILEKILRSTSKMYRTYSKAEDVFIEPELYHKFGLWKNDPCLPVWRRGPVISFAKHGQYKYPMNSYGNWAKESYWDPDFLKTKSKWGQFWRKFIRPTYQLPDWLSFYIFNSDICYKSKYDEWRYEFPAHLTLVFFGFSLSFWLRSPKVDSLGCDDHYWEGILNYLDNRSLKEAIQNVGIWKKNDEEEYFGVRPGYIKHKYIEDYYEYISEIKLEKENDEEC